MDDNVLENPIPSLLSLGALSAIIKNVMKNNPNFESYVFLMMPMGLFDDLFSSSSCKKVLILNYPIWQRNLYVLLLNNDSELKCQQWFDSNVLIYFLT